MTPVGFGERNSEYDYFPALITAGMLVFVTKTFNVDISNVSNISNIQRCEECSSVSI